jgi:transposase
VDTSSKNAILEEHKMGKRKRRKFTNEQKAEAVKIYRDSGKTIAAVARDLDLTPSALSAWIKQAEIDEGGGPTGALTSEEKAELAKLKRENKRLNQENAFLKKASAFFAKESL